MPAQQIIMTAKQLNMVKLAKIYASDPPESWEAALAVRERHFLEENPERNIDLGQSGKPVIGLPDEDLFTLLAGMGIVWQCNWQRPFHPLELLASQGAFP